jgi:hypothetical protein
MNPGQLPSAHDPAPYQVAIDLGGTLVWYTGTPALRGRFAGFHRTSPSRYKAKLLAYGGAFSLAHALNIQLQGKGEAQVVHRHSQGPIPV